VVRTSLEFIHKSYRDIAPKAANIHEGGGPSMERIKREFPLIYAASLYKYIGKSSGLLRLGGKARGKKRDTKRWKMRMMTPGGEKTKGRH